MVHKAFTLDLLTLSTPKLGKKDGNNSTIILVFALCKAKTMGNRRRLFEFLYNIFKKNKH